MSVSQDEFDKNWNSIFGGVLWFHTCGNRGIISTEKGEACPRCGAKEEKSDEKKSN